MPHISKRKLSYNTQKEILEALVYVMTQTRDEQPMREFLDAFLSNTEKLMLAKRLAIVFLLSEGVEETQISQTLSVTQSTVSRIKLWSETKGSGYKIAVTELKRKKLLGSLKILAVKAGAKAIRWASGRP